MIYFSRMVTPGQWDSLLINADPENVVVDVLTTILSGKVPEEITEQMDQDLGE